MLCEQECHDFVELNSFDYWLSWLYWLYFISTLAHLEFLHHRFRWLLWANAVNIFTSLENLWFLYRPTAGPSFLPFVLYLLLLRVLVGRGISIFCCISCVFMLCTYRCRGVPFFSGPYVPNITIYWDNKKPSSRGKLRLI